MKYLFCKVLTFSQSCQAKKQNTKNNKGIHGSNCKREIFFPTKLRYWSMQPLLYSRKGGTYSHTEKTWDLLGIPYLSKTGWKI